MLNETELTYLKFINYLRSRKEFLEKKLSSFPDGALVTVDRNGKTENYQCVSESGKQTRKYLSSRTPEGRAIINALKEKKAVQKELTRELAELNKLIAEGRRRGEKLLDAAETIAFDKNPHPSRKPDRREELKWKTARGEMVRSLNEKTVADAFYRHGINYEYEAPFQTDVGVFYPDFKVMDPYTAEIWRWEHLGKDDEEYALYWENRAGIYRRSGLIEGKNLIVTRSSDLNRIDEIIEERFGRKRWLG